MSTCGNSSKVQSISLHTFDAKSQYSIEMHDSDQHQNLTRILMMSIELHRKDSIIVQLNQMISIITRQIFTLKNQHEVSIHQNKSLLQIVANNQSSIKHIQIQLQNSRNQHIYHNQLQQKNFILQAKIKKIQQDKIQLQSTIKNLKLENSMISFDLLKAQSSEKCTTRDLSNQLHLIQNQIQQQRKNNKQLKNIIQNNSIEINNIKQKQTNLIKSYQEKIQLIQKDIYNIQYMRKSQIISQEQKYSQIFQDLSHYKQQYETIKQINEQFKKNIAQKDLQIQSLQNNIKNYQIKNLNLSRMYQQINNEFSNKQVTYNQNKKQLQQKIKKNKQIIYNHNLSAQQKQNELYLKSMQISRFKKQINDLMEERDNYKKDLKKSKIKSMTIFNQYQITEKQIKPQECSSIQLIIEEVNKLQLSNEKSLNLLNSIKQR